MRRRCSAALLAATAATAATATTACGARKKVEPFIEVAMDEDFSCARGASGTWWCWGGPYGDAPTPIKAAYPPMREGGLPPRCRVAEDHTVECKGTKVEGLTNAVGVASSATHACARLGNGTVACWGDNSSFQLADGTNERRDKPVVVQGLFGVAQVTVKGDGTCFVLKDGDVRCWGNNTHGRLAPHVHPRTVVNVPTSVRR